MLDAKKNKGRPHPYLGNSNVRWGRFDLADLAEMRFEPHEEERYGLEPGDLVVCEGGEPGRCAIWTGSEGMKIQKALHRIRPKPAFNNYYLFYWFFHAAKAGTLEPHFTGTTIKHLTGRAIDALQVPLPPVETQIAMVDVLRQLDDRITLLRETNATLEAIAQALFKSWFVDFDPVRAKMEGRAPEGMDEATAALFPDGLEASELGEVPGGWRVLSLADISTVGIGKTPPRKEKHWFSEDAADIRWVSIRDMGAGSIYASRTSEFLTDEAVSKFNVRRVPGDTVLMSFKMTIGRVAITDGEMTTNEAIAHFKLEPGALLSSEYIYLYLKQFDFSKLSSTSSIADAVNSKTVREIPILVPGADVFGVFQSQVRVLFATLKNAELQMQTLSTLRDTLLPRLISGQLCLSEAQIMMESIAAA
ncbi:restriction endonuclease subunit S [Acidovorax sp. A1169]|nr:restriction endonuclease subunit S [Acidovorax sp. A1169]MDP4078334.1 restriction endonuclease subunit S [Acidovorax sp. A1169]